MKTLLIAGLMLMSFNSMAITASHFSTMSVAHLFQTVKVQYKKGKITILKKGKLYADKCKTDKFTSLYEVREVNADLEYYRSPQRSLYGKQLKPLLFRENSYELLRYDIKRSSYKGEITYTITGLSINTTLQGCKRGISLLKKYIDLDLKYLRIKK